MPTRTRLIIVLLSIVGIAVSGYAVFTNFIDNAPPLINDLIWEPARIINDKIYDGAISFYGVDESNEITYAEVRWMPVNYTDMFEQYGTSPDAFPYEEKQVHIVTPKDGVFDEKREEFLVNITDIVGGREYEVDVFLRDKAGHEVTTSMTIPYIREYENVAALDDVLVGAFYYPWYGPSHDVHWNEGYTDTPLLGEFYSGDDVVISKDIDDATGHGIDFFVMSWWGIDEKEDQNIRIMLNNPLAGDVQFCILYESHGLLKETYGIEEWPVIEMDNPENQDRLTRDFTYFADNFFHYPNYLKIQDARVVFMYDTGSFIGNVTGTFQLLRESIDDFNYKLYLLGDLASATSLPVVTDIQISVYDAVGLYSPYNSEVLGHPNFEEVMNETYRHWAALVESTGRDFIPTVIPGYDSSGNINRIPEPIFERNTIAFQTQIHIARKYITGIDMFLICSYDEMHEGTHIKPTVEEGFAYLEALKTVLEDYQ